MRRKVLIGLFVLFSFLAFCSLIAIRLDLPVQEVDEQYADKNSHFVTLPDTSRMHYIQAGQPNQPALILIHGSYESAFTWEQVIPGLAKHLHVIAVDLPAHGLTGRTVRDRYGIEDMVEALNGLVQKLSLSHFYIVGNSMGGNTAWRYALAYPEKVLGMVLIDAVGYPNVRTAFLDQDPGPFMRLLRRYGNPRWKVKKGLHRAVANPKSITESYISRSVDLIRRAGSRTAHRMRNKAWHIGQQPVHRLREIQTETLIIWGDQDKVVSIDAAYRYDKDLPNSTLIVYKGVGHLPQLEVPHRLTKDILSFLQ